MHKMTNLEFFFLSDEFARLLVGKHFGRIRKLGENLYRMKIATIEILCESGVRIHSTKYIEATQETDKFVEKVSKELDNAKLLAITQINKDRILSFAFDRGQLIFEMFGTGNVILVAEGKTVCAQKYESWSDREIKVGSLYSPPKNIPPEKFEVSDRYIIVSLMKLPLGKEYALEVLEQLGIDEKTPGNSLSGNKLSQLEGLINEIRISAKPYGFFENGKMVDFALTKLSKYKNLETREFPSLSEAADEYYAHLEQTNPKLEKLLERLEKQNERLQVLGEEEKENRARGDYIYEHYNEAEQIITSAKTGDFDEIEKKYAAKTDKKEKSVDVEF